jgi:hypothetical protein
MHLVKVMLIVQKICKRFAQNVIIQKAGGFLVAH